MPEVPAGFVTMAAGPMCRCGIRANGRIDCFGNVARVPRGRFLTLAVGSYYDGYALDSRAAIVAGNGCFVCAIDSRGQLVCAGDHDGWGSLQPPRGRYRALAAGPWFMCGLHSDGRLLCFYPAGRGHRAKRVGPQRGRFVDVAVGRYPYSFQACGRRADGSVRCWAQLRPQIPGVSASVFDPCRSEVACGLSSPTGYRFQQIAAGLRHNCGVTRGGTIHCWGNDEHGQLAAPPGRFVQVIAGEDFSCGKRPGGATECWGAGFSDRARTAER